MDLNGKVAIVTGASAGIGAAIVKELLKNGMKVVGFARRKEKVESLVENHGGKLFALSVDVTKPQEILDGFAWVTEYVGPVHVLVNNAGLSISSSVLTGNVESWKMVMDTNFMSVPIATKEAVKIMRDHNIDGYIININSILGHYDSMTPHTVMYRSSKYALTTLTENIRIELARMKSKIRITSVNPGIVKTDLISTSYGKDVHDDLYSKVPYLLSEDIANNVMYLLSTPPHVHISEIMIRPTGEDIRDFIQD